VQAPAWQAYTPNGHEKYVSNIDQYGVILLKVINGFREFYLSMECSAVVLEAVLLCYRQGYQVEREAPPLSNPLPHCGQLCAWPRTILEVDLAVTYARTRITFWEK
jgi:hypothetical protein